MAELVADRLIYNSMTNRPAQAGNYTMMLPGMGVCGNGIGTVKVDKAGNVVWSGTLADGTAVSQTTTLSKQGRWPLYASLYGGTGEIISWMQFASQSDSDLAGQTIWIKPAGRVAYYPMGMTNGVNAAGALYKPSTAWTNVMNWTAGDLVLSGGGLTSSLSTGVTVGPGNRVTGDAASRLSLSLILATGQFRGSVLNTKPCKPISFH